MPKEVTRDEFAVAIAQALANGTVTTAMMADEFEVMPDLVTYWSNGKVSPPSPMFKPILEFIASKQIMQEEMTQDEFSAMITKALEGEVVTREELAVEFGIGLGTVDRWEAGKSMPIPDAILVVIAFIKSKQ